MFLEARPGFVKSWPVSDTYDLNVMLKSVHALDLGLQNVLSSPIGIFVVTLVSQSSTASSDSRSPARPSHVMEREVDGRDLLIQ
jgi:hypothetical protein